MLPQILLSCSHTFHADCLRALEVFLGSKVCPMCRRKDYYTRVSRSGIEAHVAASAKLIQRHYRGYTARRSLLLLLRSHRLHGGAAIGESSPGSGASPSPAEFAGCPRLAAPPALDAHPVATDGGGGGAVAPNEQLMFLRRRVGARALKRLSGRLLESLADDRQALDCFLKTLDSDVQASREAIEQSLEAFGAVQAETQTQTQLAETMRHDAHSAGEEPQPGRSPQARNAAGDASQCNQHSHVHTPHAHTGEALAFGGRVATAAVTAGDRGDDGVQGHDAWRATCVGDAAWKWAAAAARARGEDDCPICFQSLYRSQEAAASLCGTVNRPLYLLNCSHVFHKTCFLNFEALVSASSLKCPVCRQAYARKTFALR
eukprot:GHVT01068466.1.p2 GENE.GHVT01068466.1~~GHVT01068466.1.p2  ORF type:complete len:374 (-),score=83.85 GHVT01068466.1:290-1411(-)